MRGIPEKMFSMKYVFAVFLAVSALQCQAAELPISADKVELRIFVENGAAIAKNLFKAVNTGLDQSKPNMDKILNELAPEARTLIRKTIDDVRKVINDEDKRITQIFATLTKALDNLKPIKTCSDQIAGPAKKVALAAEKDIAKIVTEVETKYKKEIENIKVGVNKTLEKARTLFDTEVDAVVKCLTPGRKDADACLTKEIDKIVQGASEIVFEVFVLIQTSDDTVSLILPEVIEKLIPVLEKTLKDVQALLKTLTACVSKLK